jgi:hypothetical protein
LPEVEVVLSHSGFDLEGSNTQIMQVERDDDSSVRFVLIPRLEKMQSVYKEMTQLAQRMPTTAEDRAWAEHRLESVGNELWDELISEQLKQEYWKFKSRVTSVLITSEEPWIPWEILKPYRNNDDGEQENDLFWCQQFAMSRWLSGAGTADELDIKTARSIAPMKTH